MPTPRRSIRSSAAGGTEPGWRATSARSRSTVRRPLPEPRPQRRPRPMVNRRGRFVAAAMAGLDQPPHEVDVLAHPHRFVEAADRPDRVGAGKQGRRRHVADPGAGSDPGRFASEVERRANCLVPGERRRTALRGDPRRDKCDPWITEVGEQRVEPIVGEIHISVDEGNELRAHLVEPSVARRGRTAVGRQADRAVATASSSAAAHSRRRRR